MLSLNPAPNVGAAVYVPTRVRRSMQPTRAIVKGVTAHAVLVAIGGKHRYVPPTEVRS